MQPETFGHLEKLLAERREQTNTRMSCSISRSADRFFGPVIEQLGHAGLTRQSEGAWRRVIVEKPFGHDLAICGGSQRADPQGVVRRPDFSDRSLPGQRNGPKYLGAALCEWHFRAALEPRPYRPCSDYGGRDRRRRGPRPLLRKNRRAARHGAEPSVPAPCHDRDGAADLVRRRRGARQKDGAVPGDPSRLARERSARPVRRWGGARTESFETTGTSPTSRRIPQPKPMWRSSSESTIGAGRACRSICAPASTCRHARPKLRCNSVKPLTRFFATPRSSDCPPNILTLRIQPDEGLSSQFQRQAARLRDRDRRRRNGFCVPRLFRAARSGRLRDADLRLSTSATLRLFQRADTVEAAWRALQGLLDSWARHSPADFPELRRRQRRP